MLGLSLPSGSTQDITINLKPNSACPTPEAFLYENGQMWFAVFGENTDPKVNSCCGTSAVGL